MRIRKFLRASILVTAVAATALMAIPASVSADPPSRPANIAGRVVLPDNTAVEGAQVRLRRDDRTTGATTSNADGVFRFENIRPGRFAVAARKDGVGGGVERGIAKPGEVTRVKITLRRPPGGG